jgi:hypothetical protein
MKIKKLKKKLMLNKISIAQLDSEKINEVKVGLQLIKGGILANYITEYPPPICRIP